MQEDYVVEGFLRNSAPARPALPAFSSWSLSTVPEPPTVPELCNLPSASSALGCHASEVVLLLGLLFVQCVRYDYVRSPRLDLKSLTSYPAGLVFILCFVFLFYQCIRKTNKSYSCIIKLSYSCIIKLT